eukprot:scaffold28670_cov66-Phaeocystis_antarctica.AAC.7
MEPAHRVDLQVSLLGEPHEAIDQPVAPVLARSAVAAMVLEMVAAVPVEGSRDEEHGAHEGQP